MTSVIPLFLRILATNQFPAFMEIKTAPTTRLVDICTVLQLMFLRVLPGVMVRGIIHYI